MNDRVEEALWVAALAALALAVYRLAFVAARRLAIEAAWSRQGG